MASATVDLLEASRAGDLTVVARGQGQDRVRLAIHNTSKRRLNVIVPPGLVAASKVGQPAGGGGGRGGLQSMGLGVASNRQGAFGDFQGQATVAGLRSVPPSGEVRSRAVAVPVGETIEVVIPAVCLNYGRPSPTGRDTLKIMDVDAYTTDPRIRKALRSLATLGTSQGVAQAVMWRLCNDLPFEQMAERTGKVMNLHEIVLASRFVELLDESSSSELLDPASLADSRIFLQVQGEGVLGREASRLNRQLEGLRVLGLPLRVVETGTESLPAATAPALALRVVLTDAQTGETRGAIVVSSWGAANSWVPLGKLAFRENSSISVLDGPALSKTIDRAVSGAFVTVKPARRSVGSTTLKVENRLPFTVGHLLVRAGNSAGSPSVPFSAVGVGPGRSMLLPLQAASASLVEHVELNGL